jgi:heme-degrading monooxygenase HmoA
MQAHNVYFSLKDRSDSAVQTLVAACKKYLAKRPGVVFFACGTLEKELNRPVNDRDFDVALHVIFDSKASHDAYQVAPLHNAFVEENKENWAKVRVFDSQVESV